LDDGRFLKQVLARNRWSGTNSLVTIPYCTLKGGVGGYRFSTPLGLLSEELHGELT
jgi:hypothetical protein